MTNKEYIISASNCWMDLLKRKLNLSKADLESVEEQMNLLLDAIDHGYLQLDGDYGDCPMRLPTK